MIPETSLAFGPPEARAAATAGPDLPDRISLRDHVVEAEIGAFQEERGRRQRVAFGVVVEVAPRGPTDDDVDRILSYDTITDAIAAELAAGRVALLETLAERIAARILTRPQALRVFVRIEKLDRGPGALGVEIVRGREAVAPVPEVPAPHPEVIHLSNAAIAAPGLSAWLDRLTPPVILTVGPADLPAPSAAAPAAQRRIDLLAIEQNAWVLAARDRRCLVVGSRTEIDWAVRHGRIVVWAPSKMVLDAAHPPTGQDPRVLSDWLAGEVSASAVRLVETIPTETE